MTAPKFTPGPWKAVRSPSDQDPRQAVVTEDGDIWIADVRPAGRKANTVPEREANAALIAAAPELREALVALVDYVYREYRAPASAPAMRDAANALAKASTP